MRAMYWRSRMATLAAYRAGKILTSVTPLAGK